MLLSREGILRHYREGNIIIDPFDDRKLKTTSYDVSIGEWVWREGHPEGGSAFHNMYDEISTKRIWKGPYRAETAEEVSARIGVRFENVKPYERVILLQPGETVLGHTEEFIGGRTKIVAKMYGRSSIGRNCIEVCKDAGWGDVGYFNRWTMEITNNSQHFTIPLVVGRRIAQMVFYEVEPLKAGADYALEAGKYQGSQSLDELKRTWNPHMMTPKMHNDWEVKI